LDILWAREVVLLDQCCLALFHFPLSSPCHPIAAFSLSRRCLIPYLQYYCHKMKSHSSFSKPP
jgi:hypothetical protein